MNRPSRTNLFQVREIILPISLPANLESRLELRHLQQHFFQIVLPPDKAPNLSLTLGDLMVPFASNRRILFDKSRLKKDFDYESGEIGDPISPGIFFRIAKSRRIVIPPLGNGRHGRGFKPLLRFENAPAHR